MVCQFTKKQIICISLITVCLTSFIPKNAEYAFTSQNIETRGVWLNDYAFSSATVRNETLDKILSANLNTVFMIAPPIENNNGWSEVEDFSTMLNSLVEYDISVHAWIANLYRVKGQMADFTNTTEQLEQINWTLEILQKYPLLDGVHFDYIRTEHLSHVNATIMNAINSLIMQTKERMSYDFPTKFLTTAGWSLSGEICTQQDELPDWYMEWFDEHKSNPINRWYKSAYNYKGFPTCFGVQQDPVTWISHNQLDFHISMEYCYETDWWKGEVDIWNTFPHDVVNQIFMGLGWYSGVWENVPHTEQMVAREIVNKIQYGRSHKIKGFSIFELGEPNNNDSILISELAGDEDAPFWDEAISIFKSRNNGPIDFILENLIPVAIIGIIALVLVYTLQKKPK